MEGENKEEAHEKKAPEVEETQPSVEHAVEEDKSARPPSINVAPTEHAVGEEEKEDQEQEGDDEVMVETPEDKPAFVYKQFLPKVPSNTRIYALEEVVYRAVIEVNEWLDASKLEVEIWTNQKDRDHPEGNFHSVKLPYRGPHAELDLHVYGEVCVITTPGTYEFTYRAKMENDAEWENPPKQPATHGTIQVGPCTRENLAVSLRNIPDYHHIIGPLNIGNEVAAAAAKILQFTHLLCVAEELKVPKEEEMEGVLYAKINMKPGVEKAIEGYFLKEAIEWIKNNWSERNKLLVYSKYGFMRAGIVAIAFLFAHNPEITYLDVLNIVYCKRPVFPHVALDKVLYELYPR